MAWFRTRRRRRARRKRARLSLSRFGKGSVTAKGHVVIRTKKYRGQRRSRVVYRLTKGPLPAGYDVDHKNRIPHDDRPSNLRRVKHERHPLLTFKGKTR